MDILLNGNRAEQFRAFWNRWKYLQPDHDIYRSNPSKLDWSVPVAIHCDEGTSQKKKALMVIQYQAILGQGSRKRKADEFTLGVNFLGNSVTTRHLFSVMVGRLYSLKKNKNRPLLRLVGALSEQLQHAFLHGFPCDIDGLQRQIYLVPLGFKGDWPALVKIGCLSRHHGRDTPSTDDGPGICHLCLGGQRGCAWHDVSFNNMENMRRGASLPWKHEPLVIKPFQWKDKYKASFFRFDLFHTCHKGVFADICANIVVSRPVNQNGLYCFPHIYI